MPLSATTVQGTVKPDGTLELDEPLNVPAGRVVVTVQPLSQDHSHAPRKRWTATELRRLHPAERDAILAEQAALLEHDYRNNPEVTDFEAFGDEDLYVDGSETETR